MIRFRLPSIMLALALVFVPAIAVRAQGADVATTWRLLDYIAVDYAEAVADGRVVNEGEYAEMVEFSASVDEGLKALPAGGVRQSLLGQSTGLRAAIAAKAPPPTVAKLARSLGADLLEAYPVPLGPAKAPDLTRGAALYAENCASCHGAAGDAKGPLSAGLDPPAIAFTDKERARERSIFALYQVIDQGLEGTAMTSFRDLPAEDKWALAFEAGRFAFPDRLSAEGKRIWETDPALRERIGSLAGLTGITPASLAQSIGQPKADAVIAYLRSYPDEAFAADAGSLTVARDKLSQSLAAYEAGDRAGAERLALAAYLDGFEPVEPILSARDSGLMTRIERAMAEVRAAIGRGRPVEEVRQRIGELDALFDEAEAAIAPETAGTGSTFLGAFTILLREGLEALLIIVGMLTFLRKADRPEMVRTVHYGWIVALVAGVATWWAATHFITVSGADRELTEGFGSILAAFILLFVGIWMHGKAQADEWQRYIREKVGNALTKRSAWFLFGLAFIAVYREVFETILFFTALSSQGNGSALLGGGAAAVVVLAGIAVAMFRFSRKLPISKFFAYSSILIAVLAVVLAGKGVGALQEAGFIGVTPLAFAPSIAILGISPTVEAFAAQLATLLILLGGFRYNKREHRRLAVA